MRCCSKSTACRVSGLLVVVLLLGGQALAQTAPDDEAAVRAAIMAAIRGKMGQGATVGLDDVQIAVLGAIDRSTLTAIPDPGSRTGRTIRFSLRTLVSGERPAIRQAGRATATVHVAIEHARAAAPVPRGTILGDTDLAVSLGDVGQVPLAPVPARADIVGSRAVRDLLPGEVVTATLVRAQPLVKAGDTVRVTVRMGSVEAVGQAVAQQSGQRNDRIRLINPESRRPLFGRVTGPGEVEVIHAP